MILMRNTLNKVYKKNGKEMSTINRSCQAALAIYQAGNGVEAINGAI